MLIGQREVGIDVPEIQLTMLAVAGPALFALPLQLAMLAVAGPALFALVAASAEGGAYLL
jgi:hypothetical protein